MNVRLTLRVLGGLMIFNAGALLLPLPDALLGRDGTLVTFLMSALISAAVGTILLLACRREGEIGYREAFGIVTLGWLVFGVLGALPYWLSGVLPSWPDAVFESISGFTTTGATVIEDLSTVPASILLWRALTQWLGGMGIIVLSLAILPFLGVGGMQLFEAEVPGPTADRLRPRIQDTAKALWVVYVLITLAELAALWMAGMTFHEALCHSLATLATGGFSTENGSVGAFGGHVHVIVTVFMLLAGVNFSLHYAALRGRPGAYWKSEELRFFLGIVAATILVVVACNWGRGDEPLVVVRDASFQVVSLVTTTGFGTADYETWPVLAQYLLMGLMFLGGCAGSTGGGMKVVRALLVLKHAQLQVVRLIHPKQVRLLKLDRTVVPKEVIRSILGFFALYMSLFFLGSLIMAALGLDIVTAGASVVACLGNIGPGLGEVGPTDTYAGLPAAGKLVLTACMVFGRLELFTVLVLFFPSFWRR